jgi:CheY-like chemotaxis protein
MLNQSSNCPLSLGKLKISAQFADSIKGMKRQPESAAKVRAEIVRCCPSPESLRIVEIIKNDRAPLHTLETVIGANPIFAAHLLTLINFAPGLSQRVLTLSQAASALGVDFLKPLALGVLAFDLKSKRAADEDEESRETPVKLRDLWEHSLGAAVIAARIAVKFPEMAPLHAFTAGFIHDIGRVLLFRYAPERFCDAVTHPNERALTLRDAENFAFGIDHVTVGTDWCQRSDLSTPLCDMLRLHHESLGARIDFAIDETRKLISIVQAAEAACDRHGIGKSGEPPGNFSALWDVLGLHEEGWHAQFSAVKHEIEAAREMFGFSSEDNRRPRLSPRPKPMADKTPQLQEPKIAGSTARGQVIPFPISKDCPAKPDEKSASAKLVVLVVEDHGSLCDMVSLFLMRNGYHVRTANNGENALDILSREEIHLVLLDLMLPKVDGFEVLRQVHKTQRDKFPYVIVVSAGASDKDRKKVLDLGANEYMAKPFHLTRLLERVQAVEKFLC